MGFQSWKEEFRVPGPAGVAAPKVVNKTEDGITECYGATVPTDAATGYAPGCKFTHVDGTVGTTVYFNEGTATSCDFNAVVTGENTMVTVATGLNMNPNAAFGKVYWVDADSGDDDNDGLTPAAAFATVAAAITANNLAFAVDSDPQNTMYINAKTYTESLTAFPKNCTMIGIGGKVRIQGYHSTGAAQNCRIHNIQFRSSTASEPIITVANSSHGIEFHECVFDCSAAVSECLLFSGSNSDIVIEKCRLGYETSPANSPDIAIRFGGVSAQRGKVIDNQIYSTGIGIQVDATMISNNFLLIKDNVIACGLGSADDQMAVGINDLEVSPKGGMYVNNYISAVDAICFAAANTKSQWACLNNYVNQGATASREDSF